MLDCGKAVSDLSGLAAPTVVVKKAYGFLPTCDGLGRVSSAVEGYRERVE